MPGFLVRDVVDMDVALHGRRFIVTEFVLMVVLGTAFAALQLYLGLLRGAVVADQALTGFYAAFVTVNCLTFLVLALRSVRRPNLDLSGPSIAFLTVVAVGLLLVPFVFPLAALAQRSIEDARLAR